MREQYYWLAAGANLVWENSTADWLADKPSERIEYLYIFNL